MRFVRELATLRSVVRKQIAEGYARGVQMNVIQAKLLVMGLELEIRTMAEGRKMQMTREPAMKALGRLAGFDAYAEFGKGKGGRQKALDWLKSALAEVEAYDESVA